MSHDHFEIDLEGLRFQRDPQRGPGGYRSELLDGGRPAVSLTFNTSELGAERVTQAWSAPSEFDAGTVIELDTVRYMRTAPGGWASDTGATWPEDHFDDDETRQRVRVVTPVPGGQP